MAKNRIKERSEEQEGPVDDLHSTEDNGSAQQQWMDASICSSVGSTEVAALAACCPVCLEEDDDNHCHLSCGHSCCDSCLASHIQHCLQQQTWPVPCPAVGQGCDVTLSTPVLRRYGAELQQLQRAVGYVPCPGCGQLTAPPTCSVTTNHEAQVNVDCANSNNDKCFNDDDNRSDDERGKSKDTCFDPDRYTCQHCDNLSFCRWHGIHAHPGVPCHVYVATQPPLPNKKRQRRLRRKPPLPECRPCPCCGILLTKHAGCDHVVCTRCGTDQCWKCGTGRYLLSLKDSVVRCRNCRQSYLVHDVQHSSSDEDEGQDDPLPRRCFFHVRAVVCLCLVPLLPLLALWANVEPVVKAMLCVMVLLWFCVCCFCVRRSSSRANLDNNVNNGEEGDDNNPTIIGKGNVPSTSNHNKKHKGADDTVSIGSSFSSTNNIYHIDKDSIHGNNDDNSDEYGVQLTGVDTSCDAV